MTSRPEAVFAPRSASLSLLEERRTSVLRASLLGGPSGRFEKCGVFSKMRQRTQFISETYIRHQQVRQCMINSPRSLRGPWSLFSTTSFLSTATASTAAVCVCLFVLGGLRNVFLPIPPLSSTPRIGWFHVEAFGSVRTSPYPAAWRKTQKHSSGSARVILLL